MPKTEPVIEISAALLQRLHRIHRQRTDLQGRIAAGPRQVAAGQAMVERCRQTDQQAAETLRRARLLADQKQLQLKEREDRIEVVRGKQNAAASNREYGLLKEQIAADEQANSVLSDEILELLERIDELEAEQKATAAKLEEEIAEQQRRVATVEAQVKGLESDLAAVDAELAEAEALIPTGVRSEYQRLVAARGEEALAPVEGETCGGCNHMLTAQFLNRILMSHLVRCPNCNAFLYRRDLSQ